MHCTGRITHLVSSDSVNSVPGKLIWLYGWRSPWWRHVALKWQLEVKSHLLVCLILQNHPTKLIWSSYIRMYIAESQLDCKTFWSCRLSSTEYKIGIPVQKQNSTVSLKCIWYMEEEACYPCRISLMERYVYTYLVHLVNVFLWQHAVWESIYVYVYTCRVYSVSQLWKCCTPHGCSSQTPTVKILERSVICASQQNYFTFLSAFGPLLIAKTSAKCIPVYVRMCVCVCIICGVCTIVSWIVNDH